MYSEKLAAVGCATFCSLTLNRYKEEDYLMLSGIQHFTFCRRQWALIHVEQQWNENLRTVEGAIFHKKAHDGYSAEKRKDVIISRGMAVFSPTLGVSGVCDIVEFHRDDKRGVPLHGREGRYMVYPVEYKKGQPKEDEADVLQLAAQAMCLEEMLECEIAKGYLYYGEIRRRIEVQMEETLRQQVRDSFEEMHRYYERKYTPKVKRTKACNACSLKDLCVPRLLKNPSAKEYISKRIEEEKED
ncbi:MAG: CRISPR-associated protein Cas4 [Lachnospiraceae bacterium]|jgi:CRISPR-associated exonuclease Cas4|nr:CRISPR-associated protein Cas4 [Lachnospiraceae bacterium]MCI8997118.1 CRISPR-associated protein Cas4 [Lachnospiraceae bacterium]